jgi:hypothetical protein
MSEEGGVLIAKNTFGPVIGCLLSIHESLQQMEDGHQLKISLATGIYSHGFAISVTPHLFIRLLLCLSIVWPWKGFDIT